jgi:hypothetical protein
MHIPSLVCKQTHKVIAKCASLLILTDRFVFGQKAPASTNDTYTYKLTHKPIHNYKIMIKYRNDLKIIFVFDHDIVIVNRFVCKFVSVCVICTGGCFWSKHKSACQDHRTGTFCNDCMRLFTYE